MVVSVDEVSPILKPGVELGPISFDAPYGGTIFRSFFVPPTPRERLFAAKCLSHPRAAQPSPMFLIAQNKRSCSSVKDEMTNAVFNVLDRDMTGLEYEPPAFPNGADRRGARNPYGDRDLLLPQVHRVEPSSCEVNRCL